MFSFSRLRAAPAKKPRTECCCQPVTFMTAAIVVPADDCSIAMTRDCFVLRSPPSLLTFALVFDCDGDLDATGRADLAREEEVLTARFLAGFDIGIIHSGNRGLSPPPPKPRLGHKASGAGSQHALCAGNGNSTALFAKQCESCLSNLIAAFRRASPSWIVR